METTAVAYADQDVRAASRMRWVVFALTWVSYASYYLTRKPFSVTKDHIQVMYDLSIVQLGHIDVAYLSAYAIGQFVWGWIGDRVGPRRMLGFGMLATAGCTALFGISRALPMFLLLWFLNGIAQGTGWSSNVKAMTLWFSQKRRGSVMGVWATCYQIGGLVASPVALVFLAMAAGGQTDPLPTGVWPAGFLGPAAVVAVIGIVILLFLPDVPAETHPERKAATSAERREARALVIRTPLVWALGASYFFMKLIRYALLFWLKYYLGKKGLKYPEVLAFWIPMAFEAGGTVGSIGIGAMSDRVFRGRRLGVGIVCLLALAAVVPLFAPAAREGAWAAVAVLVVIGFFLFGPDTLLSSTAAQDLGGPRAASTAAGFINGLGSLGPIVGTYTTSLIAERYGWDAAFLSLSAGAVISAAILAPFWWRQRR